MAFSMRGSLNPAILGFVFGTSIVTAAALADEQKQASAAAESQGKVDEIVVTALKREERLHDVPAAVSVVSAESLVDSNQTRIVDYYTQIPGMSISQGIQNTQTLVIRGLATSGFGFSTAPAVLVTLDDVIASFATFVPDIDPSTLKQVEVLRGPQGTLYGANTTGGLVRYVTLDPSMQQFSGRVSAGVESVENGDGLGYTLRGSVNLPVSENFAVRASGFSRRTAGYIDNPVLGIDGINRTEANGAHLVALWKPSDTFSLKLSALYQVLKGDGSGDITRIEQITGQSRPLGDLQQGYVRGAGPYERISQIYSAVLTKKFSRGELTSVTAYNDQLVKDYLSLTANSFWGGTLSPAYFGVATALQYERLPLAHTLSEELRYSVPLGTKVDARVGGYYSHLYSGHPSTQQIYAVDPASGARLGQTLDDWYNNGSEDQYALFGELTFHATDRLDLVGGVRRNRFVQNVSEVILGGLFAQFVGSPPALIFPAYRFSEDVSTYRFSSSFKFTPDLMAYATVSTGYHPGGPNTPPLPPVQPDKLKNYELGAKADFLDHRLSFDAALYYIDWTGLQVSILSDITHTYASGNAGKAKSEGAELSVAYRPGTGWRLAAWMAYNNAELGNLPAGTQINGTLVFAGDRLPYSARISGNVSLDKEFPLGDWQGFVGGSMSYVGERKGELTGASRESLPAYARTDLRGGVKGKAWTANLYVNNAANRRGLISGGAGFMTPYSYSYIQPRTIGLTLTREFQ